MSLNREMKRMRFWTLSNKVYKAHTAKGVGFNATKSIDSPLNCNVIMKKTAKGTEYNV